MDGLSLLFQILLERVEARRELIIRGPKRRLWFDAELACKVGDREKKIAELFRSARRAFGDGFAELADLLVDLIDDVGGFGPVKPARRAAPAHFVSAKQRRHRARTAREYALWPATPRL